MRDVSYFEAIATLVGTTIGAGIFGLPYVFAQAGWVVGLLHVIVIGFIIMLINLYVGQITLTIPGKKQLTGYAEVLLGKPGKIVVTFTMVFSILGALVAYLIGEGIVLHQLTSLFSPVVWSLIFFVFASTIVFLDLSAVKRYELHFSIAMLTLLFVICVVALFNSRLNNFVQPDVNFYRLLLPYGVILFAFLGAPAIPEMRQELKKHPAMLKKAIVIGTLLPIIFYLFFSLAVISVTGQHTTQISTVGLGKALGMYMIIIGNLLAVFAMATSFLALALALKWVLWFDYNFNKHIAWLVTCCVPLILFLLGARDFIAVLATTGAIAGGIEGIALLLMAYKCKQLSRTKKAKQKYYTIPINPFIIVILSIFFVIGIIYQFLF